MLFWPASLDLLHELSFKKKKRKTPLSPSSKGKDRHSGKCATGAKSVPQEERQSRSFGQRAAGLLDWPRPMAALKGSRPFGKQQPWPGPALALALKPSSASHCLRDAGRSFAASPTMAGLL